MSQDVKYFNVCNHIVNNVRYDVGKCPRCYGKGYFLDIFFNQYGDAMMSTGNIKLQQEMLKIILEKKYDNPFNPEWGSSINNLIGTKNLSITKMKLEIIIRETLEYLKTVQNIENSNWKHMTVEEILDKVLDVEIIPLTPTGYNVKVTISNQAGETFIQSISL